MGLVKLLKAHPDGQWKDLGEIPEDLAKILSKEKAMNPDDYDIAFWGTASKVYESRVTDPFGQKYLLGIFESPMDAVKAYKKVRSGMPDMLAQKPKEINAKLQADVWY